MGPELAHLRDTKRIEVASTTDAKALDGLVKLARTEGILCALESAHAVFQGRRLARELGPDKLLVINLSGRGDKDTETVSKALFGERGQP